ncbi:MAG: hypothetical protein ACRC0Y_14940 [Fusobacteriaceae bacterium]
MYLFFGGIVLGILSMLLVFAVYIRGIENSRKKVLKKLFKKNESNDEEIDKIIKNAKSKILKFNDYGVEKSIVNLKEVSLEMAVEISKRYNPEAKYPHLELTIYELLMLNLEITKFLMDNLDKKYFEILKKTKVSHIMHINDLKEQHFDKVTTGSQLFRVITTVINPVKAAVTTVLLPIATEAIFRLCGSYGIEKLGKELDIIYSGHYTNIENEEKVKEMITNSIN